MMPNSIGNLARMLVLRQGNLDAKQALSAQSRELTTGISADIPRLLGGDATRLGHIEARLQTLSAYTQGADALGARARDMQLILENLQSTARTTGAQLLQAAATPLPQGLAAATAQAHQRLADMIGLINTRTGGEYLFAGTRNTTAPLADADALLAAVRTAIGAETDPELVMAAVSDFFDAAPGTGGFVDTIYLGSTAALTAAIAPGQNASLDVNGASPAIRDALKGMVLMALSAEAPHDATLSTQAKLVEGAGLALLQADGSLTALRGAIGSGEAVIAQAQARNAAEGMSLDIARNDLIGVDRYEVASALAETQARLEAIYSLTARLSRLSLANYL